MSHIQAMKQALEKAYRAGFNASGEGYNAEYPFDFKDPEQDGAWLKDRDNYVSQAIADAEKQQALDKMAENARELGLSYEQPALAQESVIQDWMKPDALCDRSCLYACTEGFTKFPTCVPHTAPAPDPDELTIAYMSGIYEGKKRKPLTDEQIANLFSDSLKAGEGHSVTDWVRRVEAAHGITKGTP